MAKSDDLAKRMEALNGGPLQHRPDGGLAEVRRKMGKAKRRGASLAM